jgi:hypothetical protein
MRELRYRRVWKVNVKGARVWVFKEGIFIVWNKAADEIINLLRSNNIPGIPGDPLTISDKLIGKNYAVIFENNDGKYNLWPVAPDILKNASGENIVLRMLRLSNPGILFDLYEVPEPIAGRIGDIYSDPNQVESEIDLLTESNELLDAEDKVKVDIKPPFITPDRKTLVNDLDDLVSFNNNENSSTEESSHESAASKVDDIFSTPNKDIHTETPIESKPIPNLKSIFNDFPDISDLIIDSIEQKDFSLFFRVDDKWFLNY